MLAAASVVIIGALILLVPAMPLAAELLIDVRPPARLRRAACKLAWAGDRAEPERLARPPRDAAGRRGAGAPETGSRRPCAARPAAVWRCGARQRHSSFLICVKNDLSRLSILKKLGIEEDGPFVSPYSVLARTRFGGTRRALEPMMSILRTSFIAAARTNASSASVDLPAPRNASVNTLGADECHRAVSSSWNGGVASEWRCAKSDWCAMIRSLANFRMSVSRLSVVTKRPPDRMAGIPLALLLGDALEQLGQPIDGAMAQPILSTPLASALASCTSLSSGGEDAIAGSGVPSGASGMGVAPQHACAGAHLNQFAQATLLKNMCRRAAKPICLATAGADPGAGLEIFG